MESLSVSSGDSQVSKRLPLVRSPFLSEKVEISSPEAFFLRQIPPFRY